MTTSQQFVQYEYARSESYRLLAACFYQPQKETFIEEGLFKNLSLFLKQACPDAAVFADRMGQEIMNYSNEDLLVEYSSLFVGPTGSKAAPYGSVYLEKGRRVMGDSTSDVIDYYRRMGLGIDNEFSELPDHIAVELEFMYYLVFQEVKALQKGETDKTKYFFDAQEEFSERFMRQWVPVFCDLIKKGTDNLYYQSLAGCLSVFIDKIGTVPLSGEHMKITTQV